MATMLLPPEFKRLLSALASNKVDYLVVGGYAVIYHGYVRTTGDLDIWVALKSDERCQTRVGDPFTRFQPAWTQR